MTQKEVTVDCFKVLSQNVSGSSEKSH